MYGDGWGWGWQYGEGDEEGRGGEGRDQIRRRMNGWIDRLAAPKYLLGSDRHHAIDHTNTCWRDAMDDLKREWIDGQRGQSTPTVRAGKRQKTSNPKIG